LRVTPADDRRPSLGLQLTRVIEATRNVSIGIQFSLDFRQEAKSVPLQTKGIIEFVRGLSASIA